MTNGKYEFARKQLSSGGTLPTIKMPTSTAIDGSNEKKLSAAGVVALLTSGPLRRWYPERCKRRAISEDRLAA